MTLFDDLCMCANDLHRTEWRHWTPLWLFYSHRQIIPLTMRCADTYQWHAPGVQDAGQTKSNPYLGKDRNSVAVMRGAADWFHVRDSSQSPSSCFSRLRAYVIKRSCRSRDGELVSGRVFSTWRQIAVNKTFYSYNRVNRQGKWS